MGGGGGGGFGGIGSGLGNFGSGSAVAGAGGGGLGAGGDIFVQWFGTLTIEGGSLFGGSVTPGAGGILPNGAGGGMPGAAYGSGIFIAINDTVTFAPGSGQTLTIGDVIADMTGSHDPSGWRGPGNLLVGGGGTVRLEADNSYTGSTTLAGNGTRLELFHSDSAGSGAIVFAGGSAATLQIDGTSMPTNGIFNMGRGDLIDLRGLAFHAGATMNYAGTSLTVTSGTTSAQLTLIDPANTNFSAPVSDGFGGTEFGCVAVPFDFNRDGAGHQWHARRVADERHHAHCGSRYRQSRSKLEGGRRGRLQRRRPRRHFAAKHRRRKSAGRSDERNDRRFNGVDHRRSVLACGEHG